MMGTCLRLGFEWAHGILNAFKNTVPYGGESDLVIEKGDAHPHRLRRATCTAIPGHQSRTVIVGDADARSSAATTRSTSKSTARRSIAAAPARACTTSGSAR